MMSNNVDDHHKPLPLAADPPVGAPLRPRHHVCRDRLSAAAAAALLRGADGGGGGWKGETVVTFAGSSGAGKACLAAEVVGRRDVRAKFGDSVLWLQVGVLFFGRGKLVVVVFSCLPRGWGEFFGGRYSRVLLLLRGGGVGGVYS